MFINVSFLYFALEYIYSERKGQEKLLAFRSVTSSSQQCNEQGQQKSGALFAATAAKMPLPTLPGIFSL